MNYEDHLERFKRKQEAEAMQQRRQQEERVIALKQSLEEGQRLIETIIRPEFEALKQALAAAEISARVIVTRSKEQGMEADFSVAIRCAAGIPPIKTLEFTACAESKTFTVHIYSSAEDETLRYNQITPALVKARCEYFLSTAFPT